MSADADRFEGSLSTPRPDGEADSRPWLGVRFTCAGAYLRVYRNAAGTGYAAHCPRCGQCIRFKVGAGGVEQRFFEVTC